MTIIYIKLFIASLCMICFHISCWFVLFGDKYIFSDNVPIKTTIIEHLTLIGVYIVGMIVSYILRFILI